MALPKFFKLKEYAGMVPLGMLDKLDKDDHVLYCADGMANHQVYNDPKCQDNKIRYIWPDLVGKFASNCCDGSALPTYWPYRPTFGSRLSGNKHYATPLPLP